MNGNSAIYMGDDGNYHDKPKDWTEPAPEPLEEGVQIPADGEGRDSELTDDGTGEALPPATEPDPKTASAKTHKQS